MLVEIHDANVVDDDIILVLLYTCCRESSLDTYSSEASLVLQTCQRNLDGCIF